MRECNEGSVYVNSHTVKGAHYSRSTLSIKVAHNERMALVKERTIKGAHC